MMVNSHSSTSLNSQSSIHDIEKFTEALCDQLFINETYFGNILMTLSDLFIVINQQLTLSPVNISYNTDFLTLNILTEGISSDLLDKISLPVDLAGIENSEDAERLFLIQTLSDHLEVLEGKILQLSFDISAIHNKIYAERAGYLQTFFKKIKGLKVVPSNDHN